jgi:hypothetical protein
VQKKEMPINIYRNFSSMDGRTVAWLCDDSWSLCEQMSALEDWLKKEGKKLPIGDYVADIGICGRTDFSEGVGGGAAFPPEAMAIMAEKGIHLFLSEYPGNEDKTPAEQTETQQRISASCLHEIP